MKRQILLTIEGSDKTEHVSSRVMTSLSRVIGKEMIEYCKKNGVNIKFELLNYKKIMSKW